MLKIISCQVGSSLKRPQLLLVQDAVKDTCSFSACGVPFPSLTLFPQTRAAYVLAKCQGIDFMAVVRVVTDL